MRIYDEDLNSSEISNAPLLPSCFLQLARADINRWMLWSAQHFAPPLGTIVYEHIWKGLSGNGGPDLAELDRAAAW